MRPSERAALADIAQQARALAADMNAFNGKRPGAPAPAAVDAAKPVAEAKAQARYRDKEKPLLLAACRNCASFRCDHSDRETATKGVVFHRVNLRCGLHGFSVSLDKVCDSHAFKHEDRRDV